MKGNAKMRDTEWFYQRKWGVSAAGCRHLFLTEPDHPRNRGKGVTSWNQCVSDLDADILAEELEEIGAGYLIYCLNQVSRYFSAPNATFDRITGYRPGEACSEDDVVERLYTALSARNIDLLLTVSCDGPSKDPVAREAFGGIEYGAPNPNITDEFMDKWSDVIREFSLRYGKKIKGWWLDGCYYCLGYTDEKLARLADACRAGNPDAIVSHNIYGLAPDVETEVNKVLPGCSSDDYTFGEMYKYEALPDSPFVGHCRWHIWSWFSEEWPWTNGKCRRIPYTAEYIRDYVKEVHNRGGVVTLNVDTFREGHIFEEQKELLSLLKEI